LFEGLAAGGNEDLSLAILEQTDYPSIGYMFANTLEPASENLWELLDAFSEGTGMNSRNHHMWSSYSAYLVRSAAGLAISPRRSAGGATELVMRPAASGVELSAASVRLELPFGDAALSWRREGGAQLDKVAEGDTLRLSCGEGSRIASIDFASFGTPRGGEHSRGLAVDHRCHSLASAGVLSRRCLGRSSCEIEASRAAFPFHDGLCDRSDADPLRLWAAVTCDAPESLRVTSVVPVAATATLHLSLRDKRNARLLEGRSLVFQSAGPAEESKSLADGIVSIGHDAGSHSLVVRLGSGEFNFHLL